MEEKHIPGLKFWKGFLWGFVGAAAVCILRFAGMEIITGGGGQKGAAAQAVSDRETRAKLGELANIIDAYYYNETDAQQIADGIYSGLLESLNDPYSQYYNAEEYKALMENTSGSYYGIGTVLSQDKETGQVTIRRVYKESPAAEAGLKDGDRIISIDGTEAAGEELSDLAKQIKGVEGTSVHVVIQREGTAEKLEFDVERRQIDVPTVEYQMLDGEVGYLAVSEFSDLTAGQFQMAVAELEYQGMESMIVDVRDNPGGVLDAASAVLDQILPEGTVVYTEDKYKNRKDYVSDGETYMDIPIAVLINENSASAAEIFAGAIKDYGYGTLIGTKTFGKGIVQQIIPLEDGSALKVTIAKYFTPKGNDIHEIGIEPDIELEYQYLNPEDETYDPMHDNQVQKALEVLQSR